MKPIGPYVYPLNASLTPEGIRVEFEINGHSPSIDIKFDAGVVEWHTVDLKNIRDEGEERTFNVRSLKDWQWVSKRLREMQGEVK